MLADVPIILRQGLTFGFEYPYVNPQTGRFATEAGLGGAILDVIANRANYSPRQWVLDHMTCERSTRLLEATLRDDALAAGEPWTQGLVARVSTLDTQRYWTPGDREKFVDDYAFLAAAARR